MVADQKNSEAHEFIEDISEKGLDLSYQIFVFVRMAVVKHTKNMPCNKILRFHMRLTQ